MNERWEKRMLLPCCLIQYFCVVSRNLYCRYTNISAQKCSLQWAMLIAVWFAVLKSLESSALLSEGNWWEVLMEYYATMEKLEVDLYILTRKGDPLNSGYFWRRAVKWMGKVLWGSLLFILCLLYGWIFRKTRSLYFCNINLRQTILVILVHLYLCACACMCSLSEDPMDIQFYLALKHSFLICDYHFKSKKSLNKTKLGFCMRKK